MKNYFYVFIKSQTIKDTSLVFVGNVVSSLFAIIFSVYVGYKLGPENFGIFSAVTACIAIVSSFGDLGLGAALFRFGSKYDVHRKKQTSFKLSYSLYSIRLVSGLALMLPFLLLPTIVSRYVFHYESVLLALFAGVGVFSYLCHDFIVQYFQSFKNFTTSSLLVGINNILRVILIFSIGLIGFLSLENAILVFVLAPLIMLLAGQFLARLKIEQRIQKITQTIKTVGSFSLWSGLNRFISSLSGRVDTLLLISLLNPYDTGIYSAAKQLSIGVPIIIGSFATVLAPRFSSISKDKLHKYFIKSILLSFVLVVGLFIGIIISPYIVGLFGEKYVQSTGVLQWLLVTYIPFVIATPAVNLLIYAFGKPRIITILTITQIPLVIGGIITLSKPLGMYAPVLVNGGVNFSTFIVAYIYSVYYLKKI